MRKPFADEPGRDLDPLPWRYLNNPNIRYANRRDSAVPDKVFWQPRDGYSKILSDYSA